MKHLNPQIQKKQEEFLEHCPEEERELHSTLFRIGNATYRYHLLSDGINDETRKLYFKEWLEGLPDPIRVDMQKRGFEECKTMLPFTRYVTEREDVGMDEWMKAHLSEEDYKFYTRREKSE